MNIVLLDRKPALCEHWRLAFKDVQQLRIYNGSFESLLLAEPAAFDCLVSPANSFGLMDGGMDAAITAFFGEQLERRVQQEIWRVYRGEQPIGTCLIVPTGDARCPFLAHCPTMPVPMNVADTRNAYAAYLAALTTAEAAGVRTLACSGLGTAAGHMPLDVAAGQMRFAYQMWKQPFTPTSWDEANQRLWQASGRSQRDFLLQNLGRRRRD